MMAASSRVVRELLLDRGSLGTAWPSAGDRQGPAATRSADVTRSRRYKEKLEHANQGLEDAYAELQSTNEELGLRTAELNQLNAFLESIWAGLGGAVVVLDPDLRVLVWTMAPRTCGGSARRRCRASISSTSTSACPSTGSGRPCARP
jgi:hypothetical protein